MTELLIFGLVNTIIMTLSGVAGGGAGLFTAPFLIALGINPLTAISTSKVTGLGAGIGAGFKYHKEKILDLKTQLLFMTIGAIGAIIGSSLLVTFSSQEEIIEKILGFMIILIGLPLLFSKNLGLKTKSVSRQRKNVGYAIMFVISVVGAAISGITAAYLVVFMVFFGMKAINAAVAKRSVQLVAQSISLIIFASAGFIDYKLAIIALLTSIIGSYIGAHIAIKKGNKFVINIFAILCALLAVKLIF